MLLKGLFYFYFFCLILASCSKYTSSLSLIKSDISNPTQDLKTYNAIDITGGLNNQEITISYQFITTENIATVGNTVCGIVPLDSMNRVLCHSDKGEKILLSVASAHTLVPTENSLYFCGPDGVYRYDGNGDQYTRPTNIPCLGSLSTKLIISGENIIYSGNDGTSNGIFHNRAGVTTRISNFNVPQIDSDNGTAQIIKFKDKILLWLTTSRTLYFYNLMTREAHLVENEIKDVRVAGDRLYFIGLDSNSGNDKLFSYDGISSPSLISADYHYIKLISRDSPLLFFAKESTNIHLLTHDSVNGLRDISITGISPWGIISNDNCSVQIGTKTFFTGPSGSGLVTDGLYSFDSATNNLRAYSLPIGSYQCQGRENNIILKNISTTELIEFQPETNSVINVSSDLSFGMVPLYIKNGSIFYYTMSSKLMSWDGVSAKQVIPDTTSTVSGDDHPRFITTRGNDLFFVANDGHIGEMYRYNGSSLSKAADLVPDGDDNIDFIAESEGEIYFVQNEKLYKYNSDLNHMEISNIYIGKGNEEYFVSIKGLIYFIVTNEEKERRLYSYDGTEVKNVTESPNLITGIRKWGDKILILADDNKTPNKAYIYSPDDGLSMIAGSYENARIIAMSTESIFFAAEDLNDVGVNRLFSYGKDLKLNLQSDIDINMIQNEMIQDNKLIFSYEGSQVYSYSHEMGLFKYERITSRPNFEIQSIAFKDNILYYIIFDQDTQQYLLYKYDPLLGGIELHRGSTDSGSLLEVNSQLYVLPNKGDAFRLYRNNLESFVDIHQNASDGITQIINTDNSTYVVANENPASNSNSRIFKLIEK